MSQEQRNKIWTVDERRRLVDYWLFNNKSLDWLAKHFRVSLEVVVAALVYEEVLEHQFADFPYYLTDTAKSVAEKMNEAAEKEPTEMYEEAIINQILNLKFKGCFVKSADGIIAKVPAPIKVAVGQLLIISEGGRNLVFEVDEVFDLVPMEHVKDKIPYIVEDGLPELHEMRKAQEREARQLLIESMNQQFHEKALKLSEDFVGKEIMDEVADKLNNTSWNNLIHKALFAEFRDAK